MIEFQFIVTFGFLALFWGIYHLYPTKKDVKGTESD